MADSKEWYIGGDGALEKYSDAFKGVSEDDVKLAERVEERIVLEKQNISQSFQKLAVYLELFERERLYLARGYSSLRLWSSGPDIDLSYRLVHDLIRIQRELLPTLGPGGDEAIAAIGISKARELLPLMNEGMEEQAIELVTNGDAAALTWTDLRQEIKRIRGVDVPFDQRRGPLFYARVRTGEVKTRISIRGSDGVGVEEFGVLQIPNAWATKFIERFSNLVEFESEQ